ncbi:uncharacterized protein [Watersipora subatra]|uniref:uncharacterized protein n=1 Tax=Watersipora subatra TaxID=2589382 RepID=UPI00355B5BCA
MLSATYDHKWSAVVFAVLALTEVVVVAAQQINVTCSACQGIAEDSCDATSWNNTHTVSCNGKCVTRRTLYANGRNLRTIWRGCETTLFPGVLPNDYKDACGLGNFFVECTQTCEGVLCNMNNTGIPNCWTCGGDHQSCDLPSPTHCDEVITTTPAPQTACVSCTSTKGEMCDVRAYLSPNTVPCNGPCMTWKTLRPSDRTLLKVQRGCAETLLPPSLETNALDTCVDLSNATECTSICEGRLCNKYLSGFTECWTEEGIKKPECIAADSDQEKIPAGTIINCTACQGVAGDPCDVSPSELPHTVSCEGDCIARRTLYANGRTLRSIWRGCESTLFPLVLPSDFKNTCKAGNFFVECTDSCRSRNRCNQNTTGIPSCWSCLGDPQPCNREKPSNCDSLLSEAPTERPLQRIQCVSCNGAKGSECDTSPYKTADSTSCNSSCVTKRILDGTSRETLLVYRGCEDDVSTGSDKLDSCIETPDNKTSCMEGCYTSFCNKYTTGFSGCWTNEGHLVHACHTTTTTEQSSLINPSRITTTKAYSIQDASGGDNYRGEWRPTDVPGTENGTELDSTNSTRDEKPYGDWEIPSFRRNGSSKMTASICLIFFSTLKMMLESLEQNTNRN